MYLQTNDVTHLSIPVVSIQIVIEFLAIIFLYHAEMKNIPLEKRFLGLGVILGTLFIVLLPPGQSPDEANHFLRAYAISDGVLVSENDNGIIGSDFPSGVNDAFLDFPEHGTYTYNLPLLVQTVSPDSQKVFRTYPNTALYCFVCYLPQAIGGLMGRWIGLSVLSTALLMRACNFVVWLALVYLAIKTTPVFKDMFLFIALLPITIQEATSISPDALTIGLALFLTAFVLHLTSHKHSPLSKGEIALLYIMAIIIGLCKIVYIPIILLYLIIPTERFGSSKSRWVHLSLIAFLSLAINLSWLLKSSSLLVEINPGVNSKAHVSEILTNPIKYFITILRTIDEQEFGWIEGMLGHSLGAFVFFLPRMYFCISYAMLVGLLLQRNESFCLHPIDRIVIFGVFLTIVLLIFSSLYIQWTTYGSVVIQGVQGRYFLPILPLLPIIICRSGKAGNRKSLIPQKAILYYGIFINVIACVSFFAYNV